MGLSCFGGEIQFTADFVYLQCVECLYYETTFNAKTIQYLFQSFACSLLCSLN